MMRPAARTKLASCIVALVPVLAVTGCTTTATLAPNVARSKQTVMPVVNGEATFVEPGLLAHVMLRAGFTSEEILEHGPGVAEALATSGAAQVRQGKAVSALMAIQSGQLIVTSLERGTFVVPLRAPGSSG